MLRHQLPVQSPLPFGALLAGLGAVAAGRDRRPEVARILRERLGARDVLLTDSGTSALGLAIRGALTAGGSAATDEVGNRDGADRAGKAAVALPGYCCYDVATAADWAGAPVVLYDVDPETLGPAWESFEAALAAGARAVVVAHLFGIPVDMRKAGRLARASEAVLIEDAAQAAGASYAGRPLGCHGDLAVLSFGRGKGTTGGGGGALVARDDRAARVVEWARAMLRPGGAGIGALARLTAQWVLARPGLYALPSALPFLELGETIYRPPGAPREAARVHGAVLRRTLPLEAAEAHLRQAQAGRLAAAARAGGGRVPSTRAGGAAPSFLRCPVVLERPLPDGEWPRARRLGIMPGYPGTLADLPGFGSRVKVLGEGLPGARALAERLITLPTHRKVNPGDLARLERWLDRRR